MNDFHELIGNWKKIQNSSTKYQINYKLQYSMTKTLYRMRMFRISNLRIGIYLEFVF